MFSLLQLIIYLDNIKIPEVNVISHFENITVCEEKINSTFNRNKKAGMIAKLKVHDDDYNYLEISFPDKSIKTFWFCEKTIF